MAELLAIGHMSNLKDSQQVAAQLLMEDCSEQALCRTLGPTVNSVALPLAGFRSVQSQILC